MATSSTSLEDQLNGQRAAAMAAAPAMFAALDENISQLASTGAVAQVLKRGATAPDFSLPAADGGRVCLADLLARGPVVVTSYRGEWCPFYDLSLRALESALPAIIGRGASLVAISPQTIEYTTSTANSKGLSFPLLSDSGNATARSYGLVFSPSPAVLHVYAERGFDLGSFNGNAAMELPMPATFVIARDATVRWVFVDPDFTRRADPREILSALDELQ